MSTAMERLARANPFPGPLDERAHELAGSWQELDPTPIFARGRRRLVVAVAAGVAVLVAAGAALALRADWIDFSQAEHAPPDIVKRFSDLDVQAPPGMAPGVIADQTRRIPVPDNTGRVWTFWVAPTRSGGWCMEIADVGGGCDRLGAFPVSAAWGAWDSTGKRPDDPRVMTEIDGFVRARFVDSLRVRFADGATERANVVWVSAPIGGGFFYFEVPPSHRIGGREAVAVEALDADGNIVMSEYNDPSAAPVPPPEALTSEQRALARAPTPDGEAVLWSAPTRYGGVARWVEIGGTPRHRGAGAADATWIPTPHSVVVAGSFAPRFRSVTMTFADYSHVTVPLHDGALLYVVPAGHLTPATALAEIKAVPERGTPVNIEVFPGLSGCQAPLPTKEVCG